MSIATDPIKRANQLANLRTFKPGQSGNPGGGHPLPAEYKKALTALVPEALEVIRAMLRDPKVPHPTRLAAANSVLDRRYGRARETVDANVTVQQWTDGEVLAQAQEVLEGVILTPPALPEPEVVE